MHTEISKGVRERDVNTWEEFEDQLRAIQTQAKSPLFFRGQSNSSWALCTTLDRELCGERTLFKDYYRSISKAKTEIESLTNKSWNIPEYTTVEQWISDYDEFSLKLSFGQFPAYSYMVHLRHHGFPSPLLDWSRSQYVAAYFAFSKFRNDDPVKARVSIHVFSEAQFRMRGNNMPLVFRLGPHVRTHRRHVLQQSDYTLCVVFDGEWRFAEYQTVFDWPNQTQGSFWKFNIPYSERVKVLKKLDQHNLNAFSLFGSEESLMETMALRTWHLGEESLLTEGKKMEIESLKGIKAEAKKLGFTRIKLDGDNTPWIPLEKWNGVSDGTNTPHHAMPVEYWLDTNRVRVTKERDDQEYWYTLG